MRIFDPHLHASARTTDDYEALHAAGVRALVEPAFWQGQPRTSVATFLDYFATLTGWEPFRASQYGIAHHCALGLNPREANDPRCVGVLDELPRLLAHERVVAVGEIGYDEVTPAEDEAFARQVALAVDHGLPVLVHTPHRDKPAGVRRTLALLAESGIDPTLVVVDNLTEDLLGAVADAGHWRGVTLYPDAKVDPARLAALLRAQGTDRILVNTAADWARSDPLLTRATGEAMLAAGFTADDVDLVLWRNPVDFYSRSGRLTLAVRDPGDAYAGNSIFRG